MVEGGCTLNTMRTIEATAVVTAEGTLTVRVPPDIPPGEHQVVIMIGDAPAPAPARDPEAPLVLQVFSWVNWPADSTFRREDIYGDDGR